MTSRIVRFEKTKDSNDNDEVFLQVEVNDGTEVFCRAEWLSSSDVALVMADENNINAIAVLVANRAVVARPAAKAAEEYDKALALEKIKLEIALAEGDITPEDIINP